MLSVGECVVRPGDSRAEQGVSLREAAEGGWFPSAYDCLHDIAERLFHYEAKGHTLQATAIVHEAYVRLARGGDKRWRNRNHFLAVASRTLREVLVDHARRRSALKRGGGRRRVDLDMADISSTTTSWSVVDLDEALTRMSESHLRASRVVELRYFGGLSIDETAAALDVSPRTVKSDWRFARAWLNLALTVDA